MRKRSKQTLSHYRLLTGQMGELMPISAVPVIPGDTFQHHTSLLVRAAPLNTPVMHPVNVRVHHWFVPNRIVWDGWEDFITGGEDGMDNSMPPQVNKPGAADGQKEIAAYMGVPATTRFNNTINALPIRAYNLIYNRRYRDQDLVPEVAEGNLDIQKIAWEKDYFTTARPWSQKGPDVTVPIGIQAPVKGSGENAPYFQNFAGDNLGYLQQEYTGGDDQGLRTSDYNGNTLEDGVRFLRDTPIGAYADLSDASGVTINQFREAFAIQRYQEARARYGARFTEYLRYLGIRPSDARLQEPEFLGGGSSRLNFSEVLQTSPSASQDEAGVGDLYGHGIAGVRTNKYRKFFEEHGYVITLVSVRPKAIYQNMSHREWWKRNKEDYYQQELVHLGQQEIWKEELWPHQPDDELETWGYQDRYDEYRYHPSQVSQDFRNTLDSWHLARNTPEDVALNKDFVECDPSNRIFQVTEGDNLWIMANQHIVARRLLPKRSRPKIF